MDPLAALGLATNIVQFIDFSLELFSTANEVARSARGATERTLELGTVYETLSRFAAQLQQPARDEIFDAPAREGHGALSGLAGGEANIRAHTEALGALAADCKAVCDQLLGVIRRLRVSDRGSAGPVRWLKALAAALKTAYKEKEIASLEERLKRFQTLIALHYFPLLELQCSYMRRVLNELRIEGRRLGLEQMARLEALRDDLRAINKKLESNMVPLHDASGRRRPSKHGPAPYPKDVQSLEDILSSLSLKEKDLETAARERVLIKSLNFASREYRHEDIPAAHQSTFKWIFPAEGTAGTASAPPGDNDAHHSGVRSHLFKWLQAGNGTFWVSGKAGAGKSTLMKFVTSQSITGKALEAWARPKDVFIAAHYFWNAGTAMQKSLKGLLQALLYDMLRYCPRLAPDVLPEQWRSTQPTNSPSDREWSTDELYDALRALARHPAVPAKFCCFVDGLDEFDGDHFELCQLLAELSSSANLKFCVSSRPWNVFEDAFAGKAAAELCIHELTFEDIRRYAASRLTEHPHWKSTCISQEQSDSFVQSIAERAQGVFLWVFLVTRSLRDGLVNGDTIRDLQGRLDALPTDLGPFFMHMLNIVDPFYHGYMSRTLQITIGAREPLHLLTYYISEFEELSGSYALERPLEPELVLTKLPPKLLEPCRRRVNARCGGLLAIEKNNRVELIHRTVRDFLLTDAMQNHLRQKTGPNYKVNLAILKALAYQLRCLLSAPSLLENVENMQSLWHSCLSYTDKALSEDDDAAMFILDHVLNVNQDHHTLDSALSMHDLVGNVYQGQAPPVVRRSARSRLQNMRKRSTSPPASVASPTHTPAQPSRGRLLRYTFLKDGVQAYVLAKLRTNPQYFDSPEERALTKVIAIQEWNLGHVQIMSELIRRCADPNEKVASGETLWKMFLTHYIGHGKSRQEMCLMDTRGPRTSLISLF